MVLFLAGSGIYLEIIQPTENFAFLEHLFSPHFISQAYLYGGTMALSLILMACHTILFARYFFFRLTRITLTSLFLFSILLFIFSLHFILVPQIVPPWWLILSYLAGAIMITAVWRGLLAKISGAYWKKHYLQANHITNPDKENLLYLLQKNSDIRLEKKLFRHYILDGEYSKASQLFKETDLSRLDPSILQDFFLAHYRLQQYRHALKIGNYLLSLFSEKERPPEEFIENLFLSCYHLGHTDQGLELYYTYYQSQKIERPSPEFIKAAYTILKEHHQYEEISFFLQKTGFTLETDDLRKILLDFLSHIYRKKRFSILVEILNTFFSEIPPRQLYHYILHLKQQPASIKDSYYHLLIRFHQTQKQKEKLKQILEEYFLTGQPFREDYYQRLKEISPLSQKELQHFIEQYPYQITPYKDYFATLSLPAEKARLMEKIQKVLPSVPSPEAKNFQSLANTLKKEFQSIRKTELENVLSGSLSNHDAIREYLLLLAEMNEATDTYHFLQRLKSHFEEDRQLENVVWDVIHSHPGSFHIGENLMNHYLHAGKPEKSHKLIQVLAEYTMEKERYSFEKYQELYKRFPDYMPVYPSLIETSFKQKNYQHVTALSEKFFNTKETISHYPHLYSLYLISLEETGQKEEFINKTKTFLSEYQTENIDLIRLFVRTLRSEQRYEEALNILQNFTHLKTVVEVIAELEEDYTDYRKQGLKDKIESNKEDYESCFQLGMLYLTEKDWNQAFICFQKCFGSKEYDRLSHAYGALALAHKNLLDLSEELLFQVQLHDKDIPAQELNTLKEIFYETGRIFDENKLYHRSVNIYLQIFKIDANFRDVMKKIENYDLYLKSRKKKM